MTAPTPPAGGSGSDREETPGLLSVVGFEQHDPYTGWDRPVVGVVMRVDGDELTVVPLQGFSLQVAAADVDVVTAADLAPSEA